MRLKDVPRRLGYVLGAQWTRDAAWAAFTILLARRSPETLGQILLALSYGYLVKTVADVGLNDFLLSSFARRQSRPSVLLAQVTWLKCAMMALALAIAWWVTGNQGYAPDLRLVVMTIALGFGMDGVSESFFALCQARGRQDVELRIRAPSAVIGIGYGIACVLADAPVLFIALYKGVESLACMLSALSALRRNPFKGFGLSGLPGLARQMREGIVFTCMAACAMFYNKLNVFFLKRYGGDAAVGEYGVAWETVDGLSVLVSGALLGKVIFPLLAELWDRDREAFRKLAGGTARSLWAAALALMFLIIAESDRLLPLIYGGGYTGAVTAQRLLAPCIATAFLHNLAAYAMIGMGRHKLLLRFYLSGLAVNVACCIVLIPMQPLEGAALSLMFTKVWVAVLTVGFFQYALRPMSWREWLALVTCAGMGGSLWWLFRGMLPREVAEVAGLVPMLFLCWRWRPPTPFQKETSCREGELL
ncbi:MAG: oligosaccharide flippase family protein [Desulfovibrio sp.]|jgi:O-antigen/teichoic acid export membrane protein|nr:oligosaccharide flippase family protein [Desulfovibrio sp.]